MATLAATEAADTARVSARIWPTPIDRYFGKTVCLKGSLSDQDTQTCRPHGRIRRALSSAPVRTAAQPAGHEGVGPRRAAKDVRIVIGNIAGRSRIGVAIALPGFAAIRFARLRRIQVQVVLRRQRVPTVLRQSSCRAKRQRQKCYVLFILNPSLYTQQVGFTDRLCPNSERTARTTLRRDLGKGPRLHYAALAMIWPAWSAASLRQSARRR